MNLRRSLIDNVLESSVKLGPGTLPIRLYYPIASMIELLECSEEELPGAVEAFCESERDTLGALVIEPLKANERKYSILIPPEGVIWINEHEKASEFTKTFLTKVRAPGMDLTAMTALFHTFDDAVCTEVLEGGETALFFERKETDPYVYVMEDSPFGLEYHRFTRKAFARLKEGKI